MAKNTGTGSHGILTSFIGGFIFTIILVVAVPVICNHFIQPYVEDMVGDNAFMWFSSSLIVTVIMLAVMVLFSMLLGGGAILRKFGLIGVVALIIAYWALGNLPGAVLPVLCLLAMYIWQLYRGKK